MSEQVGSDGVRRNSHRQQRGPALPVLLHPTRSFHHAVVAQAVREQVCAKCRITVPDRVEALLARRVTALRLSGKMRFTTLSWMWYVRTARLNDGLSVGVFKRVGYDES